jgi:Tfp pilus assembly protein PilE
MIKQQVQAFTIMEMTITMLVAAILIGITYTSYSIISKSYLSFTTKNTEMAGLETLDKLLKRDFDRAELIKKDTSGILLESPGHIVKYEFMPDFIVRTSGRLDTFKIKTVEFTTLFEGLPVNEVSSSEEQNRLDQLDIILLFQTEKIPYHYHKQYSSANLIQRKPDAIH